MKEGLWRIVTGQETAPTGSETERAKFAARRDRALATVVLSVDTSLLYLVGDPEDPVVVWKKLADQFEKKTWATRLDLCRKLHSLRLNDGDSVQEHIKIMTELFDALSVAGETVSEEDRSSSLPPGQPARVLQRVSDCARGKRGCAQVGSCH